MDMLSRRIDPEELRSLLRPDGVVVREYPVLNPYTGEYHHIRTVTVTRTHPETGHIEVRYIRQGVTTVDGETVYEPGQLVFCSLCGLPVSRSRTLVCLRCGRLCCHGCSAVYEHAGLPLRLCSACAHELSRGRLWHALLRLLPPWRWWCCRR